MSGNTKFRSNFHAESREIEKKIKRTFTSGRNIMKNDENLRTINENAQKLVSVEISVCEKLQARRFTTIL